MQVIRTSSGRWSPVEPIPTWRPSKEWPLSTWQPSKGTPIPCACSSTKVRTSVWSIGEGAHLCTWQRKRTAPRWSKCWWCTVPRSATQTHKGCLPEMWRTTSESKNYSLERNEWTMKCTYRSARIVHCIVVPYPISWLQMYDFLVIETL